MLTPLQLAVKKAGRARLLADMSRAAKVVQSITCGDWPTSEGRAWAGSRYSRARALGYAEGVDSQTVTACLMTAFGC